MTAKFVGLQDISIRPQNDTEKLIFDNLCDLLLTKDNYSITIDQSEDMKIRGLIVSIRTSNDKEE